MSRPMIPLGLGFLALLSFTGFAQEKARSPRIVQVEARELWTADGKRVEHGRFVAVDGRIRSLGADVELDPRHPILRHAGVVTAGLIACETQSGAEGELLDDTRSVLPAARTVHAFHPEHSDFERALRAGITSVVLAPGAGDLVGGVACVVKTAGARVLKEDAALAISLSSAALGRSTARSGFFFGAAEEGGGPEGTTPSARGTRLPTSYPGAVALLDELFARGGEPFSRAAKGELPVLLDAWERHEVLRAASFAKRHRLVGAIRGAPLAGDPEVIAALKESGLGVIVGPYAADQAQRSRESLKLASEAGVPVAFALDSPEHSPEDLRLSAVRALRAGATREAAWKALTSDAARLSGVGDSVGSLEPDRDADFVLWSGDPLDLESHVTAVFVDGELAWSAQEHAPVRK